MIKILRRNCPQSLQKPNDQFVEDDYKKSDVLKTLLNMQYGKCCYCERYLLALSPTEREVDHFMPKSSFKDSSGRPQWHLANNWKNLLYSCRTCNNKKLNRSPFNQYSGEREIIDPSIDIDPEEHIEFIIDYPVISYKARNSSLLGGSTIDKLKLSDREDLYANHRKIMLEIETQFTDIINAIISNDTLAIKQAIKQLEMCMSANKPFAAFSRCFIRERLEKLNDKQLPRLEIKHGRSFEKIDLNMPKGYELVS